MCTEEDLAAAARAVEPPTCRGTCDVRAVHLQHSRCCLYMLQMVLTREQEGWHAGKTYLVHP